MNLLSLNATLLFALSIPVVMGYRILPVEGTPYWLFGMLFALLLVNILRPKLTKFLIWPILVIVVGGTTWTAIVDRVKTAPVYGVHDIILQQEAAMRYLLQGKNPYKETYFGTPVEQFNYDESGNTEAVNPALYHFVMPPWYLFFPFFTYLISMPIFGFFDGRMVLLVALFGILLILHKWFKNKALGYLAITLTAISPSVVNYFIEGRSDVFALFWFIWSLYLLEKKKFFLSSIIFGLALMSKQTIWLALPFYFLMIKPKFWIVSLAVGFVLTIPFLLWDLRAFFDSIVGFLSGSSSNSYPIGGYGFGMVLHQAGIIKNLHAYFPFIVFQLLFAVPILVLSIRWLLKKPSVSRLLLGYAITLTVFWYFSRYFNNSHLGYISGVFILGALKEQDT